MLLLLRQDLVLHLDQAHFDFREQRLLLQHRVQRLLLLVVQQPLPKHRVLLVLVLLVRLVHLRLILLVLVLLDRVLVLLVPVVPVVPVQDLLGRVLLVLPVLLVLQLSASHSRCVPTTKMWGSHTEAW